MKVILSRTRPQLVQRLFEQEIPEIADGVIEIRAMAREPGYRTKVAVSSTDQRVDCVGACVGVRGNRIKNIVDELAGERIDIVRWNDNLQVLDSQRPAAGRSRGSDPLPDAGPGDRAGARGSAVAGHRPPRAERAAGEQAVRLGHRNHDPRRARRVDRAGRRRASARIEGVETELAEKLVGEGFLSYDDLSIIEPDALMEMGGLTEEQVDAIVEQAEGRAEEAEAAATEARKQKKERERLAAIEAERTEVEADGWRTPSCCRPRRAGAEAIVDAPVDEAPVEETT